MRSDESDLALSVDIYIQYIYIYMYIYIYIYLAIIAHEVLHVDFLRSFARKRGAKRRERLILERGSELLPVKVVDARVAAAEVEPRVARPRRATSRGHLSGEYVFTDG